MTIRINPWYAVLGLVLFLVVVVGLSLQGSERHAAAPESVALELLPTPTLEPTPTPGWWGTVVFTETATLTSTVALTTTTTLTDTAPLSTTTVITITAPVTATATLTNVALAIPSWPH